MSEKNLFREFRYHCLTEIFQFSFLKAWEILVIQDVLTQAKPTQQVAIFSGSKSLPFWMMTHRDAKYQSYFFFFS